LLSHYFAIQPPVPQPSPLPLLPPKPVPVPLPMHAPERIPMPLPVPFNLVIFHRCDDTHWYQSIRWVAWAIQNHSGRFSMMSYQKP